MGNDYLQGNHVKFILGGVMFDWVIKRMNTNWVFTRFAEPCIEGYAILFMFVTIIQYQDVHAGYEDP